MTENEAFILKTVAASIEALASAFSDLAAKSELLSLHLPNLAQEQREELSSHHKIQLNVSQQLKQQASELSRLAGGN